MSRKDYKLLAEAFAEAKFYLADESVNSALLYAANRVADKLKQDNSNFDREKFLSACFD